MSIVHCAESWLTRRLNAGSGGNCSLDIITWERRSWWQPT